MTPSELKYHVESANDGAHFFSRETMRFFGDTMRNYGVRRAVILSNFDAAGNYHAAGVTRECWELYRRRPVKGGNKASAFFDAQTFRRVHARI